MRKKSLRQLWNFSTNRPLRDRPMGPYTKSPWKHYVYVWVDVNGLFYVGRGQRRRGWADHFGDKGVRTKAQIRRETFNRSFKCLVVHDGMTKSTAKYLEAVLIQTLQPACNKQLRKGHQLKELKETATRRKTRSQGYWEEKGRKSLEIQEQWKKRLGKSLKEHVQEREAAKCDRKVYLAATRPGNMSPKGADSPLTGLGRAARLEI